MTNAGSTRTDANEKVPFSVRTRLFASLLNGTAWPGWIRRRAILNQLGGKHPDAPRHNNRAERPIRCADQ